METYIVEVFNNIKYIPEKVDEAIRFADISCSSFSSNLIGKIKSVSIPAKCRNYSNISSTLYKLSSTIGSASSVNSILKSMKESAELSVKHQSILSDFSGIAMEIVIQNGKEAGYVFKPDKEDIKGLPMITYLSGTGTTSFDRLNHTNSTETIFSKSIIDGSLNLDAVVFMPIQKGKYGYQNQINDGSLIELIDTVANENKVDHNRKSLFGFSVGCLDGANLAAKYGDYFSFIALAGERIECMEELSVNNPNAKFVFIDERTMHGHREDGFEQYFGNRDAVLYETTTKFNSDPKHSSGFFMLDKLLFDAMNVVKGEEYLTPRRGNIIQTSYTEFVSSDSSYLSFFDDNSDLIHL